MTCQHHKPSVFWGCLMFQRTSVASMPARTTGASGASAGQAILAAAQSAFFQQQQAQQSQPQPQQPHGPPPGKPRWHSCVCVFHLYPMHLCAEFFLELKTSKPNRQHFWMFFTLLLLFLKCTFELLHCFIIYTYNVCMQCTQLYINGFIVSSNLAKDLDFQISHKEENILCGF